MERRKLFETMSPEARKFYMRIMNTAILNLHAVRLGFFDILLCETDDPRDVTRWHTVLPTIIDKIVPPRMPPNITNGK